MSYRDVTLLLVQSFFDTNTLTKTESHPTIAAYLILFLASLLIGIIATPLVRWLALRFGVVNAPSSRNIHLSPVPLLGGLAIYFGCMAGLVAFSASFSDSIPFFVPQIVAILAGASIISFFGLLDDKWGLPPSVRIAAQFGVAAILVATGVKFEFLPIPWANVLLSMFWVVGITNAINFLDNMDGLSAGVSAIAAGFFFLVAFASGQWLVAALGSAMAGAAFGFVYHNFGIIKSRTSIFMGDSGALFLGHLLSAIGLKLHFPVEYAQVTWLVPMLILGVPIFDTSLVVISRLRRHLSPLRGGRDHTSHRLVALGLTKREAVLVLYLIGGAVGVAGLMVTMLKSGDNNTDGYIVSGLVVLLAIWSFVRLEQLPLIDTNPKVESWSKGIPDPRLHKAKASPIEPAVKKEETKVG
jgi:UDP-GlcNAc:undecaprenyl-phosphate GlcNAc-1-phosphate transferase